MSTKIICSPGCYVQGPGELGRLAAYCDGFGTKKVYLIVDAFIEKTYGELIKGGFDGTELQAELAVFGGECSDAEIGKHRAALDGAGAVVGVGGGKTLDTSKAVAHYEGLPVVIVPTAASTDAPCSRLSVIYTETGEFDRYLPLPKNPDVVVVDTEVVAKAPARFLMAGIGDAMATYYEAAACVRSNATTMAGGHVTKAAFALAKLCRETLLEDGLKAKAAAEAGVSTLALENVIEANTYLSGVGFESSGLAAAHAVHDGMTALEETHKFLHGEKVAFGTMVQMMLENDPEEEILAIAEFQRACGLPVTLSDLGLAEVSDERLLAAAELACAPGDTMGNMPLEVTPADIVAAMRAVSALLA